MTLGSKIFDAMSKNETVELKNHIPVLRQSLEKQARVYCWEILTIKLWNIPYSGSDQNLLHMHFNRLSEAEYGTVAKFDSKTLSTALKSI